MALQQMRGGHRHADDEAHTGDRQEGFTGSVDESFSFDGNPQQLDTATIRIYITSEVPAIWATRAFSATSSRPCLAR
jgi:hypothetical protein